MSLLSKVELKRQLQSLGINVENNHIKKSDFDKVFGSNKELALAFDALVKALAIFSKQVENHTDEKETDIKIKEFKAFLMRKASELGVDENSIVNIFHHQGI
jgi:cytochrome c peroxidase